MVPGARAERGAVGRDPQGADTVFVSEQNGHTGPLQHIPDIYGVIVVAREQQATCRESEISHSEGFPCRDRSRGLPQDAAHPEPTLRCSPRAHPASPAPLGQPCSPGTALPAAELSTRSAGTISQKHCKF